RTFDGGACPTTGNLPPDAATAAGSVLHLDHAAPKLWCGSTRTQTVLSSGTSVLRLGSNNPCRDEQSPDRILADYSRTHVNITAE
ncbi:hypothetical protein, partial [Inquilinus sp. OTU3971]|uniref:hypothetical protein n=1 Tax=Inquilinus sp. OTU3971 TaxID=3043855 RepID=UPI00313E51A6